LPKRARVLTVSERQRPILESMVRARGTPAGRSERARVVLMSAAGVSSTAQAKRLGVDQQRVHRWRCRWAQVESRLAAAETQGVADKDLERLVCEALADRPRPGGPARFKPEQLALIISLACENPADSDLPISHWTRADLAREAIKRGYVESISPRHVDRFLERSRHQAAQKPLLADFAGQA
jgi:putative transposase